MQLGRQHTELKTKDLSGAGRAVYAPIVSPVASSHHQPGLLPSAKGPPFPASNLIHTDEWMLSLSEQQIGRVGVGDGSRRDV